MQLPEPLTTPVTIGDLDGDGVNDFLFTTSTAVHAYLTRRRPSSVLFQANPHPHPHPRPYPHLLEPLQTLIGLLIMAILVVMFTGAMGSAMGAGRGGKVSQD